MVRGGFEKFVDLFDLNKGDAVFFVFEQIRHQAADQVILTSDNPRSEDPAAILREIEAGVRGASNVRTIADRALAIAAAIDVAAAGDALLIAGKGHETYQIIGARTLPFDDREVARAALRRRGFGR